MPAWRIVNTSPLISLARVGLLDILREPNLRVAVPAVVLDELDRHGPADPTIVAIRHVSWLEKLPSPTIPDNVQSRRLGPGESAVLALALTRPGCEVVLDDNAARRGATALGISCRGTLGLVLLAKEFGRIVAARPILNELRQSGMYLSDHVLDLASAQVGESW